MAMLSAWIGQLVDARCRKDSNGRLVFLPYGRRRAGYYLDSASDYQKVKALVAIYAVGTLLFQVLGSTSALVITMGALPTVLVPLRANWNSPSSSTLFLHLLSSGCPCGCCGGFIDRCFRNFVRRCKKWAQSRWATCKQFQILCGGAA
jgi:hypothetical protein